MPRYQYTAIAPDGKRQKGTITAESPYAARKQLRARDVHATGVVEIDAGRSRKGGSLFLGGRRSKTRIIEFTKQMATLLKSGIKLTEALGVLGMQVNDPRFKNALSDIRDRVITGESLTDGMRDYGDYFDVVYISMVHVGEVTGSIAESFATVAAFMEKRQRVESKIITAMVYPVVLVFFCMAAVIVLTTAVIPKIAEQIARTGQELPWVTRALMGVSHLLTSWWVLLLAGVVGLGVWLLKRFTSTPRGAYLRDKIILALPLFGPLIKQRVVARFASTLSTLLSSGLSMAESLRVVSEVTGNAIMKNAIRQARERILAGADISTPLRDSGVIDPAVAHMVGVGEKSGELEVMLGHISENLEASTDVVIERLSAAVEPVIIIVMAAIIGLIAYATILPILEVSAGKF
jgi:type II secretory pathway component PulF